MREPHEVRRLIGYMPDSFGVYEDLLVWEYLDYFAALYKIGPAERKRAIGDVLELTDLGVKRDSQVMSLSRGMKQRLCLAKTLIHDPEVLLLDEPASGLDPHARIEIRELIRELCRMGKTVLVSSHILSELADFSTVIGIIEAGTLLAAGRMDDIMARFTSNVMLEITVKGDPQAALDVLSRADRYNADDFRWPDYPRGVFRPGRRRRRAARIPRAPRSAVARIHAHGDGPRRHLLEGHARRRGLESA